MTAPTTFSLVTLGCKANQFESAAMQQLLLQAGYRQLSFEQGADLVIINSCCVTAQSDAQSRRWVRRARRLNPACRVLVTGCAAQVQPQQFESLAGVRFVIGNREKADLLAIVQGDGPVRQVGDIRRSGGQVELSISGFSQHSRAFVQIQTGCDAFCSYCIIPFARGPSRSARPEQVVAQVRTLAEQGYAEVVLTGIHIGRYGQDLQPAIRLTTLLQQLLAETPIPRLRLGSLEPQEVDSDLIELLARQPRLCRHLHIPLQSASDTVLQRMNRHYSAAFFTDLIDHITTALPGVGLGLDVLTGFPGETAAEFDQTLQCLKSLPLSYLHVFPYSCRPGTAAASMPAQLDGDLIRHRAATLRMLGQCQEQDFLQQQCGRNLEVVCERQPRFWQGQRGFQAVSSEYVELLVVSDLPLAGQLCRVRVADQLQAGQLVAYPV
ncbi:MAG: tRNA (N(6)-L-threonylcarbamoyladenosine(37)-C(2))-methylthiotransferase MtaB [Desulfuromonas thiophila]|nr:tRNA (N(6)-L-threonylcarbamoyladenosine(37)-C(2))-methylthiotransferase MtaB [Desulfuromonas thiophila]